MRKGMPASLILRLARDSRRFMVGAGTRKARAISSVLRPPRARSVSATCASSASAGWQQVKMSSSRSSGKFVPAISSSTVSWRSSRRSFAASVRSRRIRSIARLRAVVTSQARGLAGVPSRGQRSAATVKASCADSSARSKSPRNPTRAAINRPHSSRKICSMGVLALNDGAHLDRTTHASGGDPGREVDRSVEVVRLVDEVAAQGFLRLDERAVGRQGPAVLHTHGRCRVCRMQLVVATDAWRLAEGQILAPDPLLLLVAHAVVVGPGLAAGVDQQQIFHDRLLEFILAPTTNGQGERGHSPAAIPLRRAPARAGRYSRFARRSRRAAQRPTGSGSQYVTARKMITESSAEPELYPASTNPPMSIASVTPKKGGKGVAPPAAAATR